jgi:hypothetical protein
MNLLDRLGDLHPRAVDGHPSEPQRGDLAGAQPGERGEPDEQPVCRPVLLLVTSRPGWVGHRVGEREHLVGRQEDHLDPLASLHPQAIGGVAPDGVGPQRLLEHQAEDLASLAGRSGCKALGPQTVDERLAVPVGDRPDGSALEHRQDMVAQRRLVADLGLRLHMEPGQPVGRPLLERPCRQPLVEQMTAGPIGLDGRQPQRGVGLGPERRRGSDPLPGDVVGVAGLPSTRRQLAKVPE